MNKLSLHSVLQANAKLAVSHAKKSFNAAVGLQRPSKLKPSSTHPGKSSNKRMLQLMVSELVCGHLAEPKNQKDFGI